MGIILAKNKVDDSRALIWIEAHEQANLKLYKSFPFCVFKCLLLAFLLHTEEIGFIKLRTNEFFPYFF